LALVVGVWYVGWRFAAENASPVTVHLLVGEPSDIALWRALLCAFFSGAFLAGVLMALPLARTKLVARRYRKMVVGLEAELHQLRNLPLAVEPPVDAGAEADLQAAGRTLERGA